MRQLLLVWLVSHLLAACATGSYPPASPQPPTGSPSSITAYQLRNMSIELVAQDSHRRVQLQDWKYHGSNDPVSPDYADIALLADPIAFGDLNGDGNGDAGVLLAENYGGSGVFVSAIAILNIGGHPVQAGGHLIDDRPKVLSLQIHDGALILKATIHGPNDPGCCASFSVTERLGLANDGLILLSLASETPDGVQRSISIDSPADGAQVSAGIVHLAGKYTVWPFEGTLSYRIHDSSSGDLLASGPISVAGQPGAPGSFGSQIDLAGLPARTAARLEVADVNAADGSTLAMDSIELMIK